MSLADLFEDSITQESSEWEESKEKSEGHTENPVILGESIIRKLEENVVDITIGCSNRIKECDSKVFKISCTTRKNLITDTYIDPNLPINVIPLSLYNEAFPEQITCKGHDDIRIMKRLPVMIRGFIYNIDLTVIDDIDSFINPTLTNLVLGKPFVNETGVTLDENGGSALFTNGVRKVIFRKGNEEVYEYRPSLDCDENGLQVRRSGKIKQRDPNNLKIPCMIGHKYFYNVYIDICLTKNVMSLFHYKNICRLGLVYKGENVVGRDHEVQVFVGNMTFTMGFTIVDNIEDYIDPRLSQVFFGAPFCEITNLMVDNRNGIMTFTDGIRRISYQTPYKMKDFEGIDCDGLYKLGSQLILCDDDVRRGCKNTFDLSCGFFKDVSKLGSKYREDVFEFEDPKYLHYESDPDIDLEDDLETVTNDEVT
jgi:hypothetical protein